MNFLADALVLQATAGEDSATALHQLGQLAARYLEQTLQDGARLTVCLGRSTYETISAIRPGFRAHVQVVPAMGSMPFALAELDSGALARRLAQKLGGDVLDLSAPAMADSAADAQVLRSQRDIRRALELARSADVALLGVGNLNPAQSGFAKGGFLNAAELAALKHDGAVGDMGGHILTADGRLHDNAYRERMIAVSLDDATAFDLSDTQGILSGVAAGPHNLSLALIHEDGDAVEPAVTASITFTAE